MKSKLFYWLILIPVVILSNGCGKQLPAEEPCNFVTNNSSRRVSWARMPVTFYVDDTLTSEELDAVYDAMEIWNAQFDTKVLQVRGISKQLPPPMLDDEGKVLSDGYNGIYIVDKSVFTNTDKKDEQARTSLSFRGDFIFEADILIDGSEKLYIAKDRDDKQSGKVEFISLMVHELGHVLGLEHIESPGDPVMQTRLGYGEVRWDISKADFESLECEYN